MFFSLKPYVIFFASSIFWVLSVSSLSAQDDHLMVSFSPGITVLSLSDPDTRPSSESIVADGETNKVENLSAFSFKLQAALHLSDDFYFMTGFWLTNKRMKVSNRDAAYYGSSEYRVTYVQLPVLFKYRTQELLKGLRFYAFLGPSFDFKIKENLKGTDGAHYWNLSRNRSDLDPTRGRNADNISKELFNPYDITIHVGAGVGYQLNGQVSLIGGITYGRSFFNMINPDLKFNDDQQTPVQESVKWRSSTFLFDVGVIVEMAN